MTQPRHGSRQRYAAGCRCQPCTLANSRYWQRHNNWARGRTEPPVSDVEEVQRHVRGLLHNRLTLTVIGQATGLPREVLEQALRGEPVGEGEAVAILAVDMDDLDGLPADLVLPSKPTWRRIDRITAATGWTQRRLAAELGVGQLRRRDGVTVGDARLVRDLFYRVCGIKCAVCGGPLAFHPVSRRCGGRRTA